MYHNTTNQKGQILIDFTAKTESQEGMIWNFFTIHKGESFTWTDVQKHFPDMNEVSLKRCLSDLKNAGKLVKTNEKSISKYGRPAYKYKLVA